MELPRSYLELTSRLPVGPPFGSRVLSQYSVEWLLQPGAKTAADRSPTLAIAVVTDQPVLLRRGVQLVLDVGLPDRALESAVTVPVPPVRCDTETGNRTERRDRASHWTAIGQPLDYLS
jgi:hypothetical protein